MEFSQFEEFLHVNSWILKEMLHDSLSKGSAKYEGKEEKWIYWQICI